MDVGGLDRERNVHMNAGNTYTKNQPIIPFKQISTHTYIRTYVYRT